MDKSKYVEIGCRIREIPLEKTGPSYEWEELVMKMCVSNDSGLRNIGIQELGEMKAKLALNRL